MSGSRKYDRVPARKPSASRERIYIVEDEIVIVRGLQDILERMGYSCCGFSTSGEEALAGIEAEKPDLVLMDICLKGEMDGIHLADILRSSRSVPIIFLTAYSNRDVLDRAKRTDPFGYVIKPIRENQLKVNIELAFERHRAEQKRAAFLENSRRTMQELEERLAGKAEDLSTTRAQLELSSRQNDFQKRKIDQLRQQMQELNRALSAMTSHITRTRDELESEVSAAIRLRILPILKQLQGNPGSSSHRTEFDMLSMHMNHLSSGLRKDAEGTLALSVTELRVAVLIKNGLSSEQIADDLHVSLETIKTHRRSIRKKLNLQSSKNNLSTYLKTCWTDVLPHVLGSFALLAFSLG